MTSPQSIEGSVSSDPDTNVLEQLVYYHYHFDAFKNMETPVQHVRSVRWALMQKQRILYFTSYASLVLGYVETWRLNFEQFGRRICHEAPFNVETEEITHGNILYVANTTIHPEFRQTNVYTDLRNELFQQNSDAQFFVGEALRKKTQPVKVFRVEKLLHRILRREPEQVLVS